jgi:hypothetical protein
MPKRYPFGFNSLENLMDFGFRRNDNIKSFWITPRVKLILSIAR